MIQHKTYTESENLLRKETLLRVRKAYQLSRLLKTYEAELQYHVNKPLYRLFQIPKKSGKFRMIEAPNESLKAIQQHLNSFLQALYDTVRPDCVHGFVKHVFGADPRGIVSNAKVHCGKKHVLNLDLKDFFSTVSAKRVMEVLTEEPFALREEPAILISLLSTYQKHLPTGAPTSPVLANMVCYRMDKELEAYCRKHELTFTRYADDLTFSSQIKIEGRIIEQIKAIILAQGFQVQPEKQRLVSKRGQQKVTGLVVNEKVNIDRKYIRNIRAMIYSIETMGAELAAAKHYQSTRIDSALTFKFINKLKGQIEFVGQVRGKEDGLYQMYKNRFMISLNV